MSTKPQEEIPVLSPTQTPAMEVENPSQTKSSINLSQYWLYYLALSIIGICVGILMGLSISPVVVTVISSVLGVAGVIVAGLCGLPLKFEEGQNSYISTISRVTPFPLMCLVLGIMIGASGGILLRNYHGFGSPLSVELRQNKDNETNIKDVIEMWHRLGVNEDVVKRTIFANIYPTANFAKQDHIINWDQFRLEAEIQKWTALNVDRSLVITTLLNSMYSQNVAAVSSVGTSNSSSSSPYASMLMGSELETCNALINDERKLKELEEKFKEIIDSGLDPNLQVQLESIYNLIEENSDRIASITGVICQTKN